jgi:hypothetical protein
LKSGCDPSATDAGEESITEEEAMTTSRRRLLMALLFAGFVACCGCNPWLFPLFLQGEAQVNPAIKNLALEDKSKEVKVAIVVSSRLDARQELRGVNRELSRKVVEELRSLATSNEDKLVVMEPAKVERCLANQPNWKKLDYDELADKLKTALKVDYVIDVEIDSMTLYERGTQMVFCGNAELHVELLNTNDPGDIGHDKDIRAQYPKGGGYEMVGDTNVFEFRDKFLTTVAKQIAYCFCSHPKINQMDDTREGFGE